MIAPETDRVLITGAAGAIGSALRVGLRDRWRHLRLTDLRAVPDLAANEDLVVADIADRAALETMMQGVKAVVHLAGVVGSFTLEDLFRVNARGLFDVFESARLAGVERIVFASSNHTFGRYPIIERVSPDLPPRPDCLYGVFKVWGETMLREYYDRYGIRSVSLRIGTFRAQPIDQRSLATWLSPADVAHLATSRCAIPTPAAWWSTAIPTTRGSRPSIPIGQRSATSRKTMPRTIARGCAPKESTSMRPTAASGNGRSTAVRSLACPKSRFASVIQRKRIVLPSPFLWGGGGVIRRRRGHGPQHRCCP